MEEDIGCCRNQRDMSGAFLGTELSDRADGGGDRSKVHQVSKTGEEIEARFTRLAIDPCIYRYEDAMGRIMLILHYVDDIIAATTDRALREIFFDHICKKWAITAEGQMNRFLGIWADSCS